MSEHSEVGWAYGVIYVDLHACGCGIFEDRMEFLRQALRDCPLHQEESWKKYDSPVGEWFLCLLDGADLIEHGGTIAGSWLTDKGKRFLEVLNDETSFETLLSDHGVGFCECDECNPAKS